MFQPHMFIIRLATTEKKVHSYVKEGDLFVVLPEGLLQAALQR